MSAPDLFRPLSLLDGSEMRNRFMLAPLTNQQSEQDGAASVFDLDWMSQLSRGGYALIQTCATTVEAGGIAFARQLGIHDDYHLPGLTAMAAAIREGGGLSAVQLHHAGDRANSLLGGVPAPASKRTLPGVRALMTDEVERIRDSFIAAAQRAERAGFDGVAVHGAFGWILSEVMSPVLNDRTDRYGGSLENRARLTLEVIEGIRRACGPHFQIGWEVVQEGAFQGKTLLSVFTDLPRRVVRVGAAGKIMSARRAAQVLDEGCDFVLIGRAAILQRDFHLRTRANPHYDSPARPVTAEHLRDGGLSERFIDHMRGSP